MASSRRAQSETASTTDAEIVRLALGLDRHPIAVNESFRVHHSWFPAEGAVAPDDRFCPHDRQLLAIDLGQRGNLLQDWIEDCLRHLSFRVSVCLGSYGSAPEAAKARIAANASATPLAPRAQLRAQARTLKIISAGALRLPLMAGKSPIPAACPLRRLIR